MASIREVISHKRRKLAIEMAKSNPDPMVIKRIKASINRHIKEMKRINEAKRRVKKAQAKQKRKMKSGRRR